MPEEIPPLGCMIETPGAALAADALAEEADFFAIGTNDLIQYSLAVDRRSEALAELYEPGHPGVLRMLQQIVRAAERAGIPVSLCGEMAADPQHLPSLVALGLRELSVQPRAIGTVREVVRGLELGECEQELRKTLQGIADRRIPDPG